MKLTACLDKLTCILIEERRGSVVECLTGDQGVAGLSLPVTLHCVLEQDILARLYHLLSTGSTQEDPVLTADV